MRNFLVLCLFVSGLTPSFSVAQAVNASLEFDDAPVGRDRCLSPEAASLATEFNFTLPAGTKFDRCDLNSGASRIATALLKLKNLKLVMPETDATYYDWFRSKVKTIHFSTDTEVCGDPNKNGRVDAYIDARGYDVKFVVCLNHVRFYTQPALLGLLAHERRHLDGDHFFDHVQCTRGPLVGTDSKDNGACDKSLADNGSFAVQYCLFDRMKRRKDIASRGALVSHLEREQAKILQQGTNDPAPPDCMEDPTEFDLSYVDKQKCLGPSAIEVAKEIGFQASDEDVKKYNSCDVDDPMNRVLNALAYLKKSNLGDGRRLNYFEQIKRDMPQIRFQRGGKECPAPNPAILDHTIVSLTQNTDAGRIAVLCLNQINRFSQAEILGWLIREQARIAERADMMDRVGMVCATGPLKGEWLCDRGLAGSPQHKRYCLLEKIKTDPFRRGLPLIENRYERLNARIARAQKLIPEGFTNNSQTPTCN